MIPYRGIDTARHPQFVIRFIAHYLFIQWFTHAMQALEFILATVVLVRIGQMINGCKSLGIMCRELRVNLLWCSQQFFRTGNIRQVGMHFMGKHRVVRHAFNLGLLDFTVPVSTFNQTNHQAFLTAFG